MRQIVVYSTENCPRCSLLKATLRTWERPFVEARLVEDLLYDPEKMAPLHEIGKSFRSAPVLEKDGIFHGPDELFPGGKLDEENLRAVIE